MYDGPLMFLTTSPDHSHSQSQSTVPPYYMHVCVNKLEKNQKKERTGECSERFDHKQRKKANVSERERHQGP